jgi:hypothetical protein
MRLAIPNVCRAIFAVPYYVSGHHFALRLGRFLPSPYVFTIHLTPHNFKRHMTRIKERRVKGFGMKPRRREISLLGTEA